MKGIIEKIFHGFLYGIGISIVLAGAYYYLTLQISQAAMVEYRFDPDTIEVTESREVERNGKLLILGAVKNTSSNDAMGVTVNIDLYQEGEFVNAV